MSRWPRIVSAAALAGFAALSATAQDRCSVKAVIAGRSVAMDNCAAAYYDSDQSVTLWFDAKPIAVADAERFHSSSYAPSQAHTLLQIAFCPGWRESDPRRKSGEVG